MASSAPKLMPLARLARGAFSCSVTRARQATGTHLHRILGYSHFERTVPTGDYIISTPFVVGDRKWHLCIYPNGGDDEHRGFFGARLPLGLWEQDATATYRMSILDHAGNPVHTRVVGPHRFKKYGAYHGVVDIVTTEELKRSAPFLLRDDYLDVRCDVAVAKTETKPRSKWFMRFGEQ